MTTQRIALGLTVLNLVLPASTLSRAGPSAAPTVAPVLRGRALKIVDDRGRVRAMIRVFPPNPEVKVPDGTKGYPGTVPLRPIDSEGAPNVEIAATEDGSAPRFGGESDPTHVQSLARGASTSLTLVDGDGRQPLIRPR